MTVSRRRVATPSTIDPRNRRVLLANLTDEGKALLARCEPLVLELEERLLSQLDPGERHLFRDSLERGISALGALAHGTKSRGEATG